MKRWRQLLKASKTVATTYNGENPLEFKAIGIMLAIWCIIKTTQGAGIINTKPDTALEIHLYTIQCVCLLITLNMLTSLFTGFSKNVRKKCKNDFMQFALQLPVAKEDFFKAHYYDILFSFAPTIVTLVYIIILQELTTNNKTIFMYTGIAVLLFCSIIVFQTLEIGIYMYTNISIKVKVGVYIGIFMTAVLTIMNTKQKVNNEILRGVIADWKMLNIFRFLGSIGGVIIIFITLCIAYFCAIKLPYRICKLKEYHNERNF